MQPIIDWCATQSFASWCWISLIGNTLAALLSIFTCWWIARLLPKNRIFEHPRPLSASDLLYSTSTVILNSVVAIAGWVLWKQGWIVIQRASWLRTIADIALLIVIMDFSMYVFHRLAHHRLVFRFAHASHHVHVETNPLSLFVLNPFEVLGFGALLIVVVVLIPFTGEAVFAYLTFNMIFGTIGHLAVEPLPKSMLRVTPWLYLGTSTFHSLHHLDLGYNFGFYTTIWDRLFKTLHPRYDVQFHTDSTNA